MCESVSISMCMSISVSMTVSLCVSMSVPVSLPVSESVFVSVSECMSMSVSEFVCLSVSVSVSVSGSTSASATVYRSLTFSHKRSPSAHTPPFQTYSIHRSLRVSLTCIHNTNFVKHKIGVLCDFFLDFFLGQNMVSGDTTTHSQHTATNRNTL